jgi:hypothetical protein
MDDLRSEMLAARERVMADHPEVTSAAELDPLLPEHLRGPYWGWQLENYLASEAAAVERGTKP